MTEALTWIASSLLVHNKRYSLALQHLFKSLSYFPLHELLEGKVLGVESPEYMQKLMQLPPEGRQGLRDSRLVLPVVSIVRPNYPHHVCLSVCLPVCLSSKKYSLHMYTEPIAHIFNIMLPHTEPIAHIQHMEYIHCIQHNVATYWIHCIAHLEHITQIEQSTHGTCCTNWTHSTYCTSNTWNTLHKLNIWNTLHELNIWNTLNTFNILYNRTCNAAIFGIQVCAKIWKCEQDGYYVETMLSLLLGETELLPLQAVCTGTISIAYSCKHVPLDSSLSR